MALLDFEAHDFGFQCSIRIESEPPHGDRQLESARAAGAGIEVEHVLVPLNERPMGVAEEDGGKPGGCGIKVQARAVMQHVQIVPLEEDYVRFGQFAAGAGTIDVAANRMDRGDAGEVLQDFAAAHISHVKDVVAACKCGAGFGTEQSVCITQEAEPHRLRLRICGQRMNGFFFCVSQGRTKGLLTWRRVPGRAGSSSAMQ